MPIFLPEKGYQLFFFILKPNKSHQSKEKKHI